MNLSILIESFRPDDGRRHRPSGQPGEHHPALSSTGSKSAAWPSSSLKRPGLGRSPPGCDIFNRQMCDMFRRDGHDEVWPCDSFQAVSVEGNGPFSGVNDGLQATAVTCRLRCTRLRNVRYEFNARPAARGLCDALMVHCLSVAAFRFGPDAEPRR